MYKSPLEFRRLEVDNLGILIVHAEDVLSRVIKEVLGSYGYQPVGWANNDLDGVAAVLQGHPSLNLVFANPRMQATIATAKDHKVPVVLVTASTDLKTEPPAPHDGPILGWYNGSPIYINGQPGGSIRHFVGLVDRYRRPLPSGGRTIPD